MKINEIIVENRQRVDEIAGRAIASGLGALAGGLLGGPMGAAAGAAGGAWLGQKLKNVFDPDDPMAVDHRKIVKSLVVQALNDYRAYLKSRGGTAGLTPDEVLTWFNRRFSTITIPGTGRPDRPVGDGGGQPYVFENPPPSVEFNEVKTWLSRAMIEAEDAINRRPPTPTAPEPELAAAEPAPVIPADGTTFNTNKGVYEVKRGGWVDPTGNPVSTEVSNKLSQLYAEKNKIVAVAPFPNKDTRINTSQGEFIYTNALGTWNWYKEPVSRATTPIVDPAVVQKLNEIAQQQATP